jgi:hypothetical protein
MLAPVNDLVLTTTVANCMATAAYEKGGASRRTDRAAVAKRTTRAFVHIQIVGGTLLVGRAGHVCGLRAENCWLREHGLKLATEESKKIKSKRRVRRAGSQWEKVTK